MVIKLLSNIVSINNNLSVNLVPFFQEIGIC
jgi:hypothetical protein